MNVLIKHVLYVESSAGVNVVGPRLLRGTGDSRILPPEKTAYDTIEEAQEAAQAWQLYLDQAHAPAGKKSTKTPRRIVKADY